MIKISRIAKKINNLPVLDGVSFEVKAGEIVGLVGPNGAGKTTLLNIIAGIWQADGGKIELGDQRVGYVPDLPYLYPKLTGREFLAFVGAIYQLGPQKLEQKTAEVEKALELAFWLDKLMESYPRGVRQKMTIAAMLLRAPAIFLLDEPLTNLDPKSSKLVKELLQKMAARGAAVVFSTQILDIAEKICGRIVILDHGKKLAEGTIAELRAQAKAPSNNLEEIFLQLTGGEKYSELLACLT